MQQQMLQATFRRPARQDIDLSAAKMPKLSTLKVVSYDNAKWDAARHDTLDHLRTIIQNSR
jgi:iron(III) transport system substrate-binding protein